jgi:anti-sigma regulatory factor (Ser/Thr protein kinase)
VTQDSHRRASAMVALARAGASPEESLKPGGYVVRVRRAFRGDRDQIACVREFVREALGPVPVLDEAVLLASELSTNAITHTASSDGTFDVTIGRRLHSVRIEVRDAGSGGVPVARPQDGMAEDGRGLGLVELLADRWGHTGDESGRSVFFELRWQLA